MIIASNPTAFEIARDAAFAIAALGGLWVAVRGLHTWRKQLRGQHEYDVARELLRAALKLASALKHARPLLMTGAEQVRALEDLGIDPEDENADGFAAAYQVRWRTVVAASDELDAAALEAAVLWGDTLAEEELKNLRKATMELKISLGCYLRDRDRQSRGKEPVFTGEKREEIEGNVWGHGKGETGEIEVGKDQVSLLASCPSLPQALMTSTRNGIERRAAGAALRVLLSSSSELE